MSEKYTPELDDVREAWIYWQACANLNTSSMSGAEFDRVVAKIKAEAWLEGHTTYVRRGPSSCTCAAWSSSECACGEYGNGPILTVNPYSESK